MGFNFEDFGQKVFNDDTMKKYLPEGVYSSLKKSLEEMSPLAPDIADAVADAMKNWAIENGATHFTHWFQPMTNVTAGKHDSFIAGQKEGRAVLAFKGKELIKGEPDASSFPSGGLRNTFEARGYTAWDCSSPAFIREDTLYIPTAFCSYTGEALDTKTPLLRSMTAVSEQALRLVRLFGDSAASRVDATVGAEQEYFLIDRDAYEKRLDLKICGRTLFGARPPKGQEMDDHYLGRIRLRVAEYMRQLDSELWKLGVLSKTKHNEAAPAQHELAPIFDTVNIACDHNQLTMELMRIVAKKNGLACLLHEKPFKSVSGSGKHNNWSLSTDKGINLLEPGKNPYENMQFLLVISAIIAAVDKHADLLRMSAAVPGNDHRLGGSEAPPSIISIFLGDRLTSILEGFANGSTAHSEGMDSLLSDIPVLPTLKRDESDRNRTSPFAFTGNKFEFRMVGSSESIACANYVLNTIVAESLDEICSRLENSADFDTCVHDIIAEIYKNHGRVIFNGNNYTDEWVTLAKERGLPNLKSTVEATSALMDRKNIEMFAKYRVMSETECIARHEIMLENYEKIITIEANTMLEMTKRQILPAIVAFTGKTAESYNNLKTAGIQNPSLKKLIAALSSHIDEVTTAYYSLKEDMAQSFGESEKERAEYCRNVIFESMEKLREAVDCAEVDVSSADWPMPGYTDLLLRV